MVTAVIDTQQRARGKERSKSDCYRYTESLEEAMKMF